MESGACSATYPAFVGRGSLSLSGALSLTKPRTIQSNTRQQIHTTSGGTIAIKTYMPMGS
jgi:hypothetical protein